MNLKLDGPYVKPLNVLSRRCHRSFRANYPLDGQFAVAEQGEITRVSAQNVTDVHKRLEKRLERKLEDARAHSVSKLPEAAVGQARIRHTEIHIVQSVIEF